MIEILLVIILIALMTRWSLPHWRHYQQGLRLEQSAVQLLAFLSRRQADAQGYNRSLVLWADPAPAWCVGVDERPGGDCHQQAAQHFVAPYPDVQLAEVSQREMGFYGQRNTALPGHLTLANEAGRIRVVLSARGRLRLCAEQQPVMGVPLC